MYNYLELKPWVFTDAGQRQFLRIRDRVYRLLDEAGAVRMKEAIDKETGSNWEMIACVDRMVELGELKELTGQGCSGQHRVFVEVNHG